MNTWGRHNRCAWWLVCQTDIKACSLSSRTPYGTWHMHGAQLKFSKAWQGKEGWFEGGLQTRRGSTHTGCARSVMCTSQRHSLAAALGLPRLAQPAAPAVRQVPPRAVGYDLQLRRGCAQVLPHALRYCSTIQLQPPQAGQVQEHAVGLAAGEGERGLAWAAAAASHQALQARRPRQRGLQRLKLIPGDAQLAQAWGKRGGPPERGAEACLGHCWRCSGTMQAHGQQGTLSSRAHAQAWPHQTNPATHPAPPPHLPARALPAGWPGSCA